MNIQAVETVAEPQGQLSFDFLAGRELTVKAVDEQLSSDGGLLAIRQFDERFGLTDGFAALIPEWREGTIEHTRLEMVRSRVYGILSGYPDQNDHDALRSDAVFKLIAGRLPTDGDLASQPTLSRLENNIGAGALLRMKQWFVDQFALCAPAISGELTLDVDLFDDPTHGQQQLTFFHGFYEQWQYLVRVWTCANQDQVIVPSLLHGTAKATCGAVDELEQIVAAVRQTRPDVKIHVRADSGFASPEWYLGCERLGVHYTAGLAMNSRLKALTDGTLEQAVQAYETTGQPQRLFEAFEYQALSWDEPRWVVVKCEAHAQGTNRRAIVTNRPGARVLPGAAYDEYAERGESENRNKELKCCLEIDRLSDHRVMANIFRVYLHCLAFNILARVRHIVAQPPAPPHNDLPVEALAGRDRKRYFNARRQADPLGEGHPSTWRQMLIKVAARVTVTARRVWVCLSSSWPYLDNFWRVSAAAVATPHCILPAQASGLAADTS